MGLVVGMCPFFFLSCNKKGMYGHLYSVGWGKGNGGGGDCGHGCPFLL